ncbi:MAG: hypothetical protein P4L57_09175 [Rhizomicrobium sp.]|nr:hypothetical protein [Rhizomicrobium sp.]
MRSAILIAVCGVLCLSQAGFAADQNFRVSVKFARPNTTYNTFLHDRNACLGDASRLGWTTTVAVNVTAVPATPTYNFARFGNCMLAKGYQPNPNGFDATEFWHRRDNEYWLAHY